MVEQRFCKAKAGGSIPLSGSKSDTVIKLITYNMRDTCVSCGKPFATRDQIKFCSNKCQSGFRYRQFIADWNSGKVSGGIGISCKTTSAYLRRYLFDKFCGKCSICGWKEKNPVTHKVPLEIDHIDGNADNNAESNLRLICPNCHSLTPHFRNLNKGRGRKWRTQKALKV